MSGGRCRCADAGMDSFNPPRTCVLCTVHLWDLPKCRFTQSLGTAGPDAGAAGASLITSSMIDTFSRPAPAMMARISDVAKKAGSQNGCYPGQQVCCATRCHKAATTTAAAADTEATAFGTLQKHHADQRQCNQNMDGQDQRLHGSKEPACLRSRSYMASRCQIQAFY